MLLVTESVLPSPVSARDVSDYSPSYNIPFDQSRFARNGSSSPCEPAENSVAMAKIFITVNSGQAAAPLREHELIEQSLVHWCNTSRTEFVAKHLDAQAMLLAGSVGDENN